MPYQNEKNLGHFRSFPTHCWYTDIYSDVGDNTQLIRFPYIVHRYIWHEYGVYYSAILVCQTICNQSKCLIRWREDFHYASVMLYKI